MTAAARIEGLADRVRGWCAHPCALGVFTLLLLGVKLLANSSADPDLFARVAIGRLVASSGAVPVTDPFAFTEKLPMWIDHEWLSGVVFYLTASLLGDVGLIALKMTLCALTVALIIAARSLVLERRAGAFLWTALCVLHGASAWTSTVRCQAFTYLFIPLLYLAISEYRVKKKAWMILASPLVAYLWVNLHGGFTLGVIVIGIFILSELARRNFDYRLLFVGALWGAAPALTPYGFTEFTTKLLEALSMRRAGIPEWDPLFTDPVSLWATIGLLTPLVLGLVRQGIRRDLLPLALMAFSTYCAFRHSRFLPFCMLTVATFGGDCVVRCAERLRGAIGARFARLERATALSVLVISFILGTKVAGIIASPSTFRLDLSAYPVKAVEWLRTSGATGRLLTDFNRGSFALWRLYPRFTISLDGRYEAVYPESTVTEVALALSPGVPGSRESLERINPTHILLEGQQQDDDPAARFGPEWHTAYRDSSYAVLSKAPVAEVARGASVVMPSDMWTPLF